MHPVPAPGYLGRMAQPQADGSLGPMVEKPAGAIDVSGETPEQWHARNAPEKIQGEAEQERLEQEARFMLQAEQARKMAAHDDECPVRKGKECSCRANLVGIEPAVKELRHFEWREGTQAWSADLVRVDDGRTVTRVVADPVSQTAKPISIEVREPPRWICLQCASSMRGVNIDHHCDPAVRMKAQSPAELAKTLPPEVKFGGAYRLFLYRDRAGEYHLGEMVVVGGKVVEERHLVGPESYNVIEGAILDAADSKLTP